MHESTLREKAREAIQAKRLPDRSPERMWGGPGVGACCVICGRAVKRDEVEFEMEFARDAENPGPRNYHIHVRCFAAWEFERPAFRMAETISASDEARLAAPPTEALKSRFSANGHALPVLSDDGTIAACERDNTHR
jgi:hypothetical protein